MNPGTMPVQRSNQFDQLFGVDGWVNQSTPNASPMEMLYTTQDAAEAAARRQRNAVIPHYGRQEGAATKFVSDTFGIPKTPLDAAALALGGPFGRAAKTGMLAAGAALTSEDADAGPLTRLIKGIKAYHGSPHDFDRFDMSRIGTGEGAQAYGHGLYFAEAEDVARSYRDALKGKVLNPERNLKMSALAHRMSEYEIPGKYRQYSDPRGYEAAKEYDDLMAARAADQGKMYEVNINARPEEFLEFGTALNKQTPEVKDALRSAGVYQRSPYGLAEVAYQDLADAGTIADGIIGRQARASETLRDAGIPGIRYLDQGSRGAGQGTNNYVVFDDKLIDILRKYSMGIGAAPAGAMMMGDDAPVR
jgi:hypothetical protein